MILVTGADGIVGREICNTLHDKNIEFLPIVSRKKNRSRKNSIEVNLSKDIGPLLNKLPNITHIVHLAAAVPHDKKFPDNEISRKITSRIDKNIYDLMKKKDASLIYFSTCGLYKKLSHKKKLEDDPTQIEVRSPYFKAKFSGEKLFRNEPKTKIVRLSSPIGKGLKPDLVLSRFISRARDDKKITLWGDGSRQQDFIDTRDIARFVLKAINNPVSSVFNLASGNPISMENLAKKIILVIGKGSIDFINKNDPLNNESANYSIQKAYNILKWKPKYNIEDSITSIASEKFESN